MRLPLRIVQTCTKRLPIQIADALGKIVCTLPRDEEELAKAIAREQWLHARASPEMMQAYNNGTLEVKVEKA